MFPLTSPTSVDHPLGPGGTARPERRASRVPPCALSTSRDAEQRCWNHKITNVLDHLPKKDWDAARALLRMIPDAETQEECERRRDAFAARYRKMYPKAVETLGRDWDRRVTFDRSPQAHGTHLRTSNPVESPFSAVRLRTDAAKRDKKVANAAALIWKILMLAGRRSGGSTRRSSWRKSTRGRSSSMASP